VKPETQRQRLAKQRNWALLRLRGAKAAAQDVGTLIGDKMITQEVVYHLDRLERDLDEWWESQ
jgi:hypothetical protein